MRRLRDLRVSGSTGVRYADEVLACLDHWRTTGTWPAELHAVDEAVADSIEYLWAEGGLCSRARFLVAGIQHFIPASRRYLDLSWSLVRTWQRMQPPIRAVPFSASLVLALAALARARAAADVSVLLLVGFEAMLRTGELFSLRRQDVMPTARGAVLRLNATKMGVRQARAEMVQVHAPITVGALLDYVRTLDDGAALSARSPPQLRLWLRSLLRELGLHQVHYTWYSLRRGGATCDFLEHGSLETTLLRGRWACGRTARIYIEQAVADSVEATLTHVQQQRIARLAATWQS